VSGREFRTNLGHAVDVLVHDRSRERAHLDAIHSRRQALARSLADASSGSPSGVLVRRTALMLPMPSGVDPRMWEVGALEQEESRVAAVIEDLGFQVDALQKQLDAKNEEFERELLEATASLEGALSALRMLTSELVRTIDAGVALVRPAP
jgi:hypothetical protein